MILSIKHAEAEREVQMKRMEMEGKDVSPMKNSGHLNFFILMLMRFANNNKNDDEVDYGDKIKVPSITGYEDKNYTAIEAPVVITYHSYR